VASDRAEAARIAALGGSVVVSGGQHRVSGGLVVTRSLGDRPFKPFTTAEPHTAIYRLRGGDSGKDLGTECSEKGIGCTKRIGGNAGDRGGSDVGGVPGGLRSEFLVVATDGLWDVMTSEEVVAYVKARRAVIPGNDGTHRVGGESGDDDHGQHRDAAAAPAAAAHGHGPREGGGAPLSWQGVATSLTHEALLRGSSDNVGVCVIDLAGR